LEYYPDAVDLIRSKNPTNPVFCNRPFAAERAAKWFGAHFPGKVFYATKANPAPWLMRALIRSGIDHFDVASINEVRRVRALAPGATLGLMNPVKSADTIAEAYFDHGIRIFSLDSEEELDKILSTLPDARDLTLCVRIAVPNELAVLSLGKKFGASPSEATPLLRRTRRVAERLGVCFHVGSQTMVPQAYRTALDKVQQAIVRSGVIVDVIDVGGGFPSVYPGMEPPPLREYLGEITQRFETMLTTGECELWCEPGRALCAEAVSLVVRVERRRGKTLFINDGVYGALADAGTLGWTYPVRRLSGKRRSSRLTAFEFFGPTCDDADFMRGPFMLPADTGTDDYLEIGMLGAYGAVLRTDFNGFGNHEEVEVGDEPMFSMFSAQATSVATTAATIGKEM